MSERPKSTTGSLTSAPDTLFDVIVFDFDGTLVCSAPAKRRAFFEVFPPHCAAAVEAVLSRDPDGSRHRVIPEMIAEACRMQLDVSALKAEELIKAYGSQCASVVATAPAMPGAEALLKWTSARLPTYIASMTPQTELIEQLEQRGWCGLVREAFGFPTLKADVIAMLLRRHGIAPARLLMVGDGISDRQAAESCGCTFHHVDSPAALSRMPGLRDRAHV